MAGQHLDQQLLDSPHRDIDQSISFCVRISGTNIKEARGLVFEYNFPPSSDIVDQGLEKGAWMCSDFSLSFPRICGGDGVRWSGLVVRKGMERKLLDCSE